MSAESGSSAIQDIMRRCAEVPYDGVVTLDYGDARALLDELTEQRARELARRAELRRDWPEIDFGPEPLSYTFEQIVAPGARLLGRRIAWKVAS